MRNHQNFWKKNVGRYDRFTHKDAAAYEPLYELLRPVVRRKAVRERGTGRGPIAKGIVNSANHLEAADASPEMIAEARRDSRFAKLHFSVRDMFHPPMRTAALMRPMRCISCRSRRKHYPRFVGC